MAPHIEIPDSHIDYRRFLAAGQLKLQCCSQCGTYRHPARDVCPECLSLHWFWKGVCGQGTVETFAWYLERFDPDAPEPPYNVAVVRLAEGPRLFSNIVDVELGSLAVGVEVVAHIAQRGETALLCFRPAE